MVNGYSSDWTVSQACFWHSHDKRQCMMEVDWCRVQLLYPKFWCASCHFRLTHYTVGKWTFWRQHQWAVIFTRSLAGKLCPCCPQRLPGPLSGASGPIISFFRDSSCAECPKVFQHSANFYHALPPLILPTFLLSLFHLEISLEIGDSLIKNSSDTSCCKWNMNEQDGQSQNKCCQYGLMPVIDIYLKKRAFSYYWRNWSVYVWLLKLWRKASMHSEGCEWKCWWRRLARLKL